MKQLYLFTILTLNFLGIAAQTQTEFSRLLASNITQNSEYGRAVCVNGDWAIIGALQDDHSGLTDAGGAFIYHYEGGAWVFQSKVTAGDPDAIDHFGRAVYINDNHAIVGCSYSDDPDTYNGSAYIFVNNNGTWTQQAKLLASDRRRMDRFGAAVGLYGDYAVVGCYGADYTINGTTYSNGGAAYVYHFNGTTWGEEVRLTPGDPSTEMKFGWGVSIYDNTILVGTTEDRYNNTDAIKGAAYAFTLQSGTWTQTSKLVGSDVIDGDNFGCAVSIYKDYAIVGSFEDDDRGSASGSAYIFKNNNGTWEQQQKLVGANSAAADNFGYSVGIYENMAIVGSYHSNKGYNDTGSAYLYTRTESTWALTTELVASSPAIADQLGWFVSITNGWALAGNPRWDLNNTTPSVDLATNEGCALMWQIPTAVSSNTPILSTLSPLKGATDVNATQSLTVTFDRNIQFASAASQIIIKKVADNTVFQSYSVGNGATDTNLSISGATLTISHNGFENGTAYYVQFVGNPITSTTGESFTGLTQITDWTFTTAYVAPVWAASSPTLSDQTKTAITLTGNSNQSGTYYYVVSTNTTAPTAAQLAAGQDASGSAAVLSGSGSSLANSDFIVQLNLSTLTSQTQYFVYEVVKNAGNLYTSVATLSFTMFDVSSPSYQSATPSLTGITGNSASLNIQINEQGSATYVVLPASATAPSIAQVLNKQDALNQLVTLSGTITLQAGTLSTTNIGGLSYQTTYNVYVVTTDGSGNFTETVTPTSASFTTLTASVTPPVATFTPANNTINVPVNQIITIGFDKAIYQTSDAAEITTDNVASLLTLTEIAPTDVIVDPNNPPTPTSVKVPYSATYNSTNHTITLTPTNGIKANYQYFITLASVQDNVGNVMAATSSQFTVGDAVAPVTNFFSPTANATNASISAPFIVSFNEPILSLAGTTLDASALQSIIDLRVKDAASELAFSAVIDAGNRVITIQPTAPLTASTTYSLTINQVEDVIGNEQPLASIMEFTTDVYNTWNGNGNTADFTDNANWNAPYVANASVIIPAGTPIATITTNTKINNLIIKSQGALTIQNGATLRIGDQLLIESSVNGNGSLINKGTIKVDASKVAIRQVIPNASAWYYLSSPVADFNFKAEQVKSFDNALGQYINLNATTNEMTGYMVQSSSDVTFTGALNSGEQTIPVNRTTNGQGWNLVGNPFTSAIDWDLIASDNKDNIQNAFWIWLNTNQYGTYNGEAGLGTNLDADASQIPSNHAFWVNAKGAGSLTVDNSSQIHNSQSYLKSTQKAYPMVKLTGRSGSVKDETIIAAIPQASADVESFDSEKLFGNNANALELYSKANNTSLTINSLPTFGTETVIELGYKVQSTGNYQITLSQMVAETSSQSVVLEDKLLGVRKTLTVGDSYSFSSDEANSSQRFALHILNGATATNEGSIDVYSQNHTICLMLNNIQSGRYEVTDMTGRLITTGLATSNIISNIPVKNTGIYMVSITANGKTIVRKVIVK